MELEKWREPVVSVLIRTHRRAPYLTRALESVREQTCAAHETIVISDDPTDTQAVEVVQDARAHGQCVRWLAVEPLGYPGCHCYYNDAARVARAGVIRFLDDDDFFCDVGHLAHVQVEFASGADVAVFRWHVAGGCTIPAPGSAPRFERCYIAPNNIAVRREILLQHPTTGEEHCDYNWCKKLELLDPPLDIRWFENVVVRSHTGFSLGKGLY